MANHKYREGKKKITVALVMSGGGARGFAHLGVLHVLEEYRIPIDLVVGASFGSIVAGYYAYGYSSTSLIDKVKGFQLWTGKDHKKTRHGYLIGDKLEEIFRHDLDDINIENLKIPVFILAADITKGEMVVFKDGPLCMAMRASASFPGLFDPLLYKGHLYIDGGILNSMLLNIAAEHGADLIIFSDVSIFGIIYKKKYLNFFLNVVLKFIPSRRYKPVKKPENITLIHLLPRILFLVEKHKKQCEIYRKTLPDFIIEPAVDGIRPLDFDKFDAVYKLGRDAALKQIDKIVKLVHKSNSK
ncbi:hypothetical protein ES703_27372 [subsurface metagenome]